jgi:APA family basic amino acid/polyamine antiporter
MLVAEPRSGRELVRVLGLIFGLAAVIGGAVGQGILRTPGIVAGAIPSPVLILLLWAAGAAIAAINAIPFAELGTAVPQAGGPYVFVRRAFGPTSGVIVGWADWLNNVSTQAFLSVVIAEFVHRLGWATGVSVGILAPAAIAVFFALNWTNTRLCGSSQSIGSVVKSAALLALVLVLLLVPARHAAVPQVSNAAPVAIGFGAIIVALRAIQNTYDGWNNGIYFTEEMHAPERHIPRALFGGIALIAFLYLLINAAVLHVLTPAAMAHSTFAGADALGAVLGPWADTLLTLFGIVSLAAILNLNVMFGPRIALAMARDRVLPTALATVAPGGSPRLALIATTAGAIVMAASGSYEQLIAFNVALGILCNLFVDLAALRLRRTEPTLVRPWRAPFYPYSILLAAGINTALLGALIYEDPLHSLAGTGLAVATGLSYYAVGLMRRWTVPAQA